MDFEDISNTPPQINPKTIPLDRLRYIDFFARILTFLLQDYLLPELLKANVARFLRIFDSYKVDEILNKRDC